LRERPEDIEPLVAHFVELLTGVPELRALAGAMEALRRHLWAGNARELRNFVEGALVMGHLQLGGTAPRTLDPRAPSPLIATPVPMRWLPSSARTSKP
jgi:DNA-binding NtrC family response regulator